MRPEWFIFIELFELYKYSEFHFRSVESLYI